MTASSATARLLSFMILLLSLAPLGSFYVLFCSMRGDLIVEHVQMAAAAAAGNAAASGAGGGKDELSLAEILQNPNASLEELFQAVFVNGWNVQLYQHANNNNVEFSNAIATQFASILPIRQAAAHHLTILLPWLISIVLGISISIISFFWGRHQQQYLLETETEQQKRRTQERRRHRVLRKLKGFRKELEPEDCLVVAPAALDSPNEQPESSLSTPDDDTASTASGSSPTLNWKLLRPGIPLTADGSSRTKKSPKQQQQQQHGDDDNNDESKYRTIPESCVICMHAYAVNDTVVWSPNAQCIHCFHEHCIMPWLVRKTSKQQLCPCCRQPFLRPAFAHPHSY